MGMRRWGCSGALRICALGPCVGGGAVCWLAACGFAGQRGARLDAARRAVVMLMRCPGYFVPS